MSRNGNPLQDLRSEGMTPSQKRSKQELNASFDTTAHGGSRVCPSPIIKGPGKRYSLDDVVQSTSKRGHPKRSEDMEMLSIMSPMSACGGRGSPLDDQLFDAPKPVQLASLEVDRTLPCETPMMAPRPVTATEVPTQRPTAILKPTGPIRPVMKPLLPQRGYRYATAEETAASESAQNVLQPRLTSRTAHTRRAGPSKLGKNTMKSHRRLSVVKPLALMPNANVPAQAIETVPANYVPEVTYVDGVAVVGLPVQTHREIAKKLRTARGDPPKTLEERFQRRFPRTYRRLRRLLRKGRKGKKGNPNEGSECQESLS